MKKKLLIAAAALLALVVLVIALAVVFAPPPDEKIVEVEVEKIVERPVEVERIVEVEVEKIVERPVEVERIVEVEVPVEIVITPTPAATVSVGMHKVGRDVIPGLYTGQAGEGFLESCYWARLSGASGGFDEIIANGNAEGRFYVEIAPTDAYIETACPLSLDRD